MADEIKNYENIDIPYNTYLSRGEITTPEGSLDSSNGTKEEEIKSGDSLNDIWIRNFIRSENWSPKKKGFYIDGLTGYAEFSNVFISGNIEALTGTIGGFTIGATSLSAVSGGNTTTLSSGTTAFSAGPTGTPTITITQAGAVTASNITITGGSVVTSVLSGTIAQANLNLADRGWTQTSAFSVTDADTVAWGAGTFTSADGTAYSIGAGNTGNMVSKTYVYLDTAISTIAYQTTTTATTAVGVGKVLIAIAQNGTNEATYKVLQGQGGENIDAANIVAGSITANEIAASTITAGKMSVTDLSAISANLGTITAGTLNTVILTAVTGTLDTITLTSPTGHIKAGQIGYNSGTGFYLGYSASTPKFSIGNSAGNRLTWDGSTLGIIGNIETTTTGLRLIMSADNNAFEFRNSSTLLGSLKSESLPETSLNGISIRCATSLVGIHLQETGETGSANFVKIFAGTTSDYFSVVYDSDESVTDFILTNLRLQSNWLPTVTNTYDLGSSTYKWKDIYSAGIGYFSGKLQIPVGNNLY